MLASELAQVAEPIRDAATIIIVDKGGNEPRVLMGQRGQGAAFMPSKYVFPGGRIDETDALPVGVDLDPVTASRLAIDAREGLPAKLAAAAIRELWEEAGQRLGRSGSCGDPVPECWKPFADIGLVPRAEDLQFVFRAITPPGRTRRFDARFFLADVAHLATDPSDFTAATDELSHLQWVPIGEARKLNLPFITEIVLAEVSHHIFGEAEDLGVPFFDNRGPSVFRRIR